MYTWRGGFHELRGFETFKQFYIRMKGNISLLSWREQNYSVTSVYLVYRELNSLHQRQNIPMMDWCGLA